MKTALCEADRNAIDLKIGRLRDLRHVWRYAHARERGALTRPWQEYEEAVINKTTWRIARDSKGRILGVIAWWLAPEGALMLTGLATTAFQRRPLSAVRALRRFVTGMLRQPEIRGIFIDVDGRCAAHCRLATLLGFKPVFRKAHLVRCFLPHPLARFPTRHG